MASQKDNTIFKTVSAVVLAVIGLVVLLLVLTGLNSGLSSSGGFFGGLNAGASAQSVILLIIKLLTGLFVISVIAGAGFWAYTLLVKNDDVQGTCNAPVTVMVTDVAAADSVTAVEEKAQEITHKTCEQCGQEIRNDWKLCPYCGQTIKK